MKIISDFFIKSYIYILNVITEGKDDANKTAKAFALGIFIGTTPLWGFQTILTGLLSHYLKLNKAISILASNISIFPPVVPFLFFGSYQSGYFIVNGEFDTVDNILLLFAKVSEASLSETINVLGNSFMYYFVGSFVFAAILSFTVWSCVRIIFFLKAKKEASL